LMSGRFILHEDCIFPTIFVFDLHFPWMELICNTNNSQIILFVRFACSDAASDDIVKDLTSTNYGNVITRTCCLPFAWWSHVRGSITWSLFSQGQIVQRSSIKFRTFCFNCMGCWKLFLLNFAQSETPEENHIHLEIHTWKSTSRRRKRNSCWETRFALSEFLDFWFQEDLQGSSCFITRNFIPVKCLSANCKERRLLLYVWFTFEKHLCFFLTQFDVAWIPMGIHIRSYKRFYSRCVRV